MIQQLREELELLRRQTTGKMGTCIESEDDEITRARKELQQVEGLLATLSKSWQDKVAEAVNVIAQHQRLLNDHGAKGALLSVGGWVWLCESVFVSVSLSVFISVYACVCM